MSINSMGRNWQFPQSLNVPNALLEAVGGHALLGSLLARRKITNPSQALAFLDPGKYIPAPPEDLPGMEQAVERISASLQKNEKICVWGDFDVDGQTSTALLVQALRGLGGKVDHYIPVREKESHGVNIPSLEAVIRKGVSLVVTCDTGITAHAAVDYARQQGVEMVITDHHELPELLPDSAAIINPRLLNEDHPLASLPGVGVAYKLAESLYKQAKRDNEVYPLLDLVALGIIADVALLKRDTRFLAQCGLKELRQTKRLGLLKLYELAELNPSGINEEHIGFVIGPRLNALGRLADANKAVDFFTTSNELQARLLAIELEGLNAQRQLLTTQVYQAAMSMIERDRSLLDSYALVLSYPTWPAGVIGIVASRLVDQFGKPVVLLSSPPNENARGSARSIEGINIIAAISAQKELLVNFGGHPMAAGLSIAPDKIDRFKVGLSNAIAGQISGKMPTQPLMIDAEIGLKEIDLDLISTTERFAPFGAGNPSPIFVARDLSLESKSVFGRSNEHISMKVQDTEGITRPVIWWQGGNMPLPEGRFDLAFSVRTSTYQGQPGVQMEWIDARQEKEVIEIQSALKKPKVEDFRNSPDPIHQLEKIRSTYPDLAVWVEADDKRLFDGNNRLALSRATNLAIVTIPPSRSEIAQVLNSVVPECVLFLAHDPGMDSFEHFVSRLAGLVKFTLNKYDGDLDFDRLAAACSQRIEVVKAGLHYLAALGSIQILQGNGLSMKVGYGDNQHKETLDLDELRLRAYLAETKAFRKYYQETDLAGLL